jgi:hypothetical protein
LLNDNSIPDRDKAFRIWDETIVILGK